MLNLFQIFNDTFLSLFKIGFNSIGLNMNELLCSIICSLSVVLVVTLELHEQEVFVFLNPFRLALFCE